VSLLDFVLGDRAGTYLLTSCLLVAALAIIAAIIDIPLRALHEAGYTAQPLVRRPIPAGLIRALGAAAALAAFAGAAIQTYIASSPDEILGDALPLWLITNIAFFLCIAVWGLSRPLTRHWGLSLGAFGLGVAGLFLLLAAVLRLPFSAAGVLPSTPARVMFAAIAGGILLAVGACLAAIASLAVNVASAAFVLAVEHRRHTDSLTSDWDITRRLHFRRFRARRQAPQPEHPLADVPAATGDRTDDESPE
jgi:hypothetical protein